MVLAICINDKDRPVEIPIEKWIKKNSIYEVDQILIQDDGKYGISLVEIHLDESCGPYRSFSASRFRLNSKNTSQKAEEAVFKLREELGI